MVLLGIVGIANKGKSTLFSAATMAHAEMADYPFTTIDPNKGVTYVRTKCPCKELGVTCNPHNSKCIDGIRFVPVNIIDVAGLVPGAHLGKGLGNKFLTDLAQADCLIQVIDASGRTDLEGKPVKEGSADPKQEIILLEEEISYWIKGILKRNWNKIKGRDIETVAEILQGLKITLFDVEHIAKNMNLNIERINWDEDQIFEFSKEIRKKSKPILIAANKADLPKSKENIEKLKKAFPDKIIIPTCAVAELVLRKADQQGIIRYIPGNKDFKIIKDINKISYQQKEGLKKIREIIKDRGTGVQELINKAIFEFLNMIVVYPVEDENKLTDSQNRVLPDAFLLKNGSTALDLAVAVHTDIAEHFIKAIDVRTKRIIGKDHILKDNDIIKIISKG